MTASILAHNLKLQVPNFVHRNVPSSNLFRELLSEAFIRSSREYRTLLDGLDFEFQDGDRVALLGRNGAGKTTLLRVLSGAFIPTSGRLEINGSRQALLNLGLGFNNGATVRENIYLRGTAMGLGLSEISKLIIPILDFAELSDVAHHRLSTLSSGQKMRLGFAISTSVQHDIMLLDEWFGAGDANFVDRARARLTDRVEGCRIMLLATHNFQMIRKVCTRGMVIEQGRQVFLGPVEDAIKAYKAIYQALPGYVPKSDKRKRNARKRARAKTSDAMAATNDDDR